MDEQVFDIYKHEYRVMSEEMPGDGPVPDEEEAREIALNSGACQLINRIIFHLEKAGSY